MQVVDGDDERGAGSDVQRQPVEAVQRREGRVARRVLRADDVQDRRRRRGRAPHQLGLRGDAGLEQLAHHPEAELALEVAGAGVEHAGATRRRTAAQLLQQPALADARRALDHRDAPRAGRHVGEQPVDDPELALPLDEDGRRFHPAAIVRPATLT